MVSFTSLTLFPESAPISRQMGEMILWHPTAHQQGEDYPIIKLHWALGARPNTLHGVRTGTPILPQLGHE